MATGMEEVAPDEHKKEEKDKDQEKEKLKILIDKMNPKYKIFSKEEYDSLVALKASTRLTGVGKTFAYPTSSPIGRI